MTAIRETKDLTDDNVATLKEATDRFRRTFEVTGGQLLVADEGVTALGDDEEKQETVSRYGGGGSQGSPDTEGDIGTEPAAGGGPDKGAPVNPEAATESGE
jgi:hypothetical protein